MELVIVFPIRLFQMFAVHFFEVVAIVRAFRVYALMQDKELPVLFCHQGVTAVGTAQLHGRKAILVL